MEPPITDILGDVAVVADPASAPAVPVSTNATVAQQAQVQGFLPANYASNPSLKDFKSIDAFAESYLNLKSQMGRSVAIPGKDAGTDDMNKFYERITSVNGVMRSPDKDNQEAMNQFYGTLGRPAESSGYDTGIDGESAGLLNADAINSFKETAHKANLTSDQFKAIVAYDMSRAQVQTQADQNAATNGVSVLQQRWGDQYNNRIAGAKAAFRTYQQQFPEGFSELNRVAKNNPALVAMLSDLGSSMAEKGFIDAPHAYSGSSPQDALGKLAEIKNNPDHAAHAKNQARVGMQAHNQAKLAKRELYKIAYPD